MTAETHVRKRRTFSLKKVTAKTWELEPTDANWETNTPGFRKDSISVFLRRHFQLVCEVENDVTDHTGDKNRRQESMTHADNDPK